MQAPTKAATNALHILSADEILKRIILTFRKEL